MPRRVLFVIPSLAIGGAERIFALLLRRLDRRRIDPVLALTKASGPLRGELPDDVPVIEMGLANHAGAPWRLTRLIRRLEPHAVLAAHSHLLMLLGLIRPFVPRRVRLIGRETAIPSSWYADARAGALLRGLTRALYPRMDRIVCQSQDMRDDLVERYGVPPGRTVVVNNPVDVERVEAASLAPPGLPLPDGPFVLAVGRLSREKRYDLLLQAFAGLEDTALRLVILGDGALREPLEREVRRLGLDGRVLLPGFADPYPFMRRARALALSSSFESFPNVLLEAGACGAPVAAFRCPGGVREIVEEGVTGFTAAPGEPAALADALRRTLDHPFDPAAIRARVAARFDASAIVPLYERVLEED